MKCFLSIFKPQICPPHPHQLFEQSGQDIVQRLMADGRVELLKGFGCSLSDLLQRVTESLPHCGDE